MSQEELKKQWDELSDEELRELHGKTRFEEDFFEELEQYAIERQVIG